MNNSIKIQYFGAFRLLFHTKEEIFQTEGVVTFAEVINLIDRKYGHDFLNKANHIMFFYYSHEDTKGIQLKFPKDKDSYIKNESTTKIFNAMTLG